MIVYIGIDWSEKKHDICFMHANGEVLQTIQVSHSIQGFVSLNKAREELGVNADACVVGLETAHNLLVDYLWEQGYEQIYVLPPNAVKSAQGRYRQSGAKDDRWDARLLADLLRMSQDRYSVWRPDSPLTRRIRSVVGLLNDFNQEVMRNCNRLRAVLLRYYPVALELFTKLDGPVTLAFIRTYPTPLASAELTFDQLQTFLHQQHHCQKKKWAEYYAKLQLPQLQADNVVIASYAPQAVSYAQILERLIQEQAYWSRQLAQLYAQHPDQFIYASLPAAGEFLEPALLAKLGDDRQRFPTPQVLQAVAGTCPVTQRSGKRLVVHFRHACDHDFRHIVQQWARLTIDVSPWAAAYYRTVLPRCSSSNDAIRRLANRWLEILWRLWQDRIPYDQAYHLTQHALRCKPK